MFTLAAAFLCTSLQAFADPEVVKEFEVEPLTRYRVAFQAKAGPGEAAEWELQFLTMDGLVPHEGVHKNAWQKIQSGQNSYQHVVLSPENAGVLKVLLHSKGKSPELEGLKLEKVEDKNLAINGDFAAGPGNYSGWSTRHMAELIEDDQGQILLKCQPEGYAISDPIPVEPGGIYRLQPGSTGGGRILLYDRDLLRTGILFEGGFQTEKDPQIEIPMDTAFIRVEYCDGRDYSGRVPQIRKLGIEQVQGGERTPGQKIPSYPGEIILKADAPLQEVRAAREIQHWVRKISGKRIAVLAAPGGNKGTRIFVGKGWADRGFTGDLKYLEGSDGYAVRRKGDEIYIFGARPVGALHGAIRLLEENSDLIFARPNRDFGTVYSPDPEFAFDKADFRERPAFGYRMSHQRPAAGSNEGIWQGRVGMNTSPFLYNGFRSREMGGVLAFEDNFMGVIERNPETSFEMCEKNHPEFFATIDGTRQIRPRGYICYTAPGISKAIVAGLLSALEHKERGGEQVEFIEVRTRDGWAVCSCDRCMSPITLADGSLLKPKAETSLQDPLFFSTRMAILLNEVAREFGKIRPGVSITVPGYIYASTPPAIPHLPSLVPDFCAYPTSSIRFPILEGDNNHHDVGREWEIKFREFLDRARKQSGKLSMFAYYYPAGFSAVADSAGADWLAMSQAGVCHEILLDGFQPDKDLEKGVNPWDYDATEKWIIARLMWDPTLDPQALREDYIRRAFQNSAPEMLEFFSIIRSAWKNPEIKALVNCHTPSSSLFDTFIVKPGNEERLRSLLVSAEKKAKNPNSKLLIQRTLSAFEKFATGMNRLYVPYVEESTLEWDRPDSTFWFQALKLSGFKQVSTWMDFKMAPAIHPTDVAIMRDRDHLYVRFDARNAVANGDQVEILLEARRHTTKYFFSMDRQGNARAFENFSSEPAGKWDGRVAVSGDGYAAMFRIPFSTIKNLDTGPEVFELSSKFSRMISGGPVTEESSLDGLPITMTHFPNHWTVLTVKKESSQ